MTDTNVDPGDIKPDAVAPAHQGVRFTETIVDAKDKIATADDVASAESLGIDQASFDKYVKDGVMDWASYGKEQAFKAKNSASPEGDAEQPKPGDSPANTAESAEDAATAANAQEVVEAAGLNWDEVTEKVAASGELDAADKAKLVEMGIPEVVIDDYVRAVSKEAVAHIETVMTAFGGEEGFNTVFEAVQANATDEQKDQIDGLLRDPATFDVGVALANKLAGAEPAAAPLQGKPVAGASNQVTTSEAGAKPFETYEAQVAAQGDPRYNTDPEYRDGVIKRIMVSPALNPRAHAGGL